MFLFVSVDVTLILGSLLCGYFTLGVGELDLLPEVKTEATEHSNGSYVDSGELASPFLPADNSQSNLTIDSIHVCHRFVKESRLQY